MNAFYAAGTSLEEQVIYQDNYTRIADLGKVDASPDSVTPLCVTHPTNHNTSGVKCRQELRAYKFSALQQPLWGVLCACMICNGMTLIHECVE
jgi:hypothetical protein